MVAVGVDACKKGWIPVALRTGTETQAYFLESVEELGEAIPAAEAIAIDIPIGLPDEGRRAADTEAKKGPWPSNELGVLHSSACCSRSTRPPNRNKTVVGTNWARHQPAVIRPPIKDLRS